MAVKEVAMSELIKVIVSIKDPFTLLAFFAIAVLLLAFRTKTVPESLFRLLGQNIGRDRFYRLLESDFPLFVRGVPGVVRNRRPRTSG